MGPRNQNNDTGRQSRLTYISYVFGKAKENGLVPVYWDDGGNFGTINRSTTLPMDSYREEVVDTMIRAVGNK
jgi:hypothetical protein